jgi:putative adenylate-forming enzyme
VIQRAYLDEAQRKFVPIITDFNRTTQPIIRYRLDDILTERATPCPCGSVLTALDGIEGRCDDLLFFPAREGPAAVRVFPDFIRRALLTADASLDAYRVWQRAPDLLDVALVPPAAAHPALCRAVEASLNALFERLGCRAPRLHFVAMPPPDGQKLRRVIRCFNPAKAGFHPAGVDRYEEHP